MSNDYKDITLLDAFIAGHVSDHLFYNKTRYNKNELALILSYVEQLWLGKRDLDKVTEDLIRAIESKALARANTKARNKNS